VRVRVIQVPAWISCQVASVVIRTVRISPRPYPASSLSSEVDRDLIDGACMMEISE
jgi:hypothetical protein